MHCYRSLIQQQAQSSQPQRPNTILDLCKQNLANKTITSSSALYPCSLCWPLKHWDIEDPKKQKIRSSHCTLQFVNMSASNVLLLVPFYKHDCVNCTVSQSTLQQLQLTQHRLTAHSSFIPLSLALHPFLSILTCFSPTQPRSQSPSFFLYPATPLNPLPLRLDEGAV